jgi:hypothetical protein
MGIDRVEHFMGGDAITPDKGAYDSLQHLDATSPAVTAIFKTYIEQQVYFDATLSIFGAISDREPKELYEYWVNEMEFLTPYARSVVAAKLPRPPFVLASRLFRAKLKEVKGFYDAGGRHLITLGTDCASWGEYLCGFAVHRELQALVLAGIPPAHALKTGTINSARALNLGAKLGTIEPGRFADLFVVRGNPLKDIRHTRDIRWVIKAGDVYDPNTLLASAKGKMGPMGEEDSARWKGRGALPTPGRGSRPSGASPFEGTWNLDVSQSRSQQPIPNAVLTIRSIPEGFEWRFERVTAEGKATPRIAMCHLDGKEHALSISDGRHQRHTSTCRQLEERTLEHVINHDAGKMVTTTRTVVSRDGQTLREVWRGHNEKGEKIDLVYVYDKQQ